MKSYELVAETIRGNNPGRTPVYGWIAWNLDWEHSQWGDYKKFEDEYEFDMAHIFGGPYPFDYHKIVGMKKEGITITPQMLLDMPLQPVDRMEDYDGIRKELEYYRGQRERFCYMQTPGIFECLSDPLAIENHLLYMALYPDEMTELYKRQAKWNAQFAENVCELGMDMIHVSDDWGSQNTLLFSPTMFREMIMPGHKVIGDAVRKHGKFLSLHSDGNIIPALDGVIELGYNLVHPWQEAAGMSYDLWLEKYSDKFAIMGGVCVQTALGFGDYGKLESDIRRVFSLLKGKRWVCCTTHFVQEHCTFEELKFAYDLIAELRK